MVDADKRLVSVVQWTTWWVIEPQETEEDLRRLGGVGDQSVAEQRALPGAAAVAVHRQRNAARSSMEVKLFDTTIDQIEWPRQPCWA